MQYMGSKNRIAKHNLLHILNGYFFLQRLEEINLLVLCLEILFRYFDDFHISLLKYTTFLVKKQVILTDLF